MSDLLEPGRSYNLSAHLRAWKEADVGYTRRYTNLARGLGINDSVVLLWAHGTRPVPANRIPRLAELLGMSVQKLLGPANYGASRWRVVSRDVLPLGAVFCLDVPLCLAVVQVLARALEHAERRSLWTALTCECAYCVDHRPDGPAVSIRCPQGHYDCRRVHTPRQRARVPGREEVAA